MAEPQIPPTEHRLIELFNKTNLLKTHPVEIRAIVKWYFDLLRNLMIIGVLLFLGTKADNTILKIVAGISLGLLFYSLISHTDAWIWSDINFPKYPRASKYGGFVMNAILFLCVWFMGIYYLQVFILGITNAYLKP